MNSRNYKKVGEYTPWYELLSQVDPGDLIEVERAWGKFQHWCVVFEKIDSKVLVVNVNGDLLTGIGSLVSRGGCMADIRVEELSMAIGGCPCRINNSVDHVFDPYPTGAEVARRGLGQVGKYNWSLLENNCQHWASWCRNGHLYSPQAEDKLQELKEDAHKLKKEVAAKMKGLAVTSVRRMDKVMDKIEERRNKSDGETEPRDEMRRKKKKKKTKLRTNDTEQTVSDSELPDSKSVFYMEKFPKESAKGQKYEITVEREDKAPVPPPRTKVKHKGSHFFSSLKTFFFFLKNITLFSFLKNTLVFFPKKISLFTFPKNIFFHP